MPNTEKAGIIVDWKLITMIGTVILAVVSTVTWFENRFTSFEEKLDSKYATRKQLQNDNVKIFLRQAEVTIENLDILEQELTRISGYDKETIKALRKRKSDLRRQVRRNMEKYLNE